MKHFLLKLSMTVALSAATLAAATPPAVGEKAPEFTLSTMAGEHGSLASVVGTVPVALVVLRGYPGYQCPFCTRQVQEFVSAADKFASAGVKVVFVYPGPPDDLASKAAESAAGKGLPPGFMMLLDPGYEFTNLYGLRWDAPKETAYPSTFLLDKSGNVTWEMINKGHGGRATVANVMEALGKRI